MRSACAAARLLVCCLIVAMASGRSEPASAAMQDQAIAARAIVSLTTDRPSFFLGENVLIHYCVVNTSDEAFSISVGSDYSGAPRSQRFRVEVADAQGRAAVDPYPGRDSLGGLGTSPTLAPGGRWCQSLPLARYGRIEVPGTYTVRVTHDLGWPAGEAPTGQTSLTLTMPTAADAEAILAAMEGLPPPQGVVMGEISPPYADFTALRDPVFLAPLLRRARAGYAAAVGGVGTIPTPEATQALIELLGSEPAIARTAASVLARRLPDPDLTGTLPPRAMFTDNTSAERRYLIAAAWRPEFSSDVRVAARRLLQSTDVQDVVQGAFFLQAVGDPADGPDLSAALTRAIERASTLPFEPHLYPRPRGAASELTRAANMLIARGYAPPVASDQPGDLVLRLVAIGRGTPPDDWPDLLARALAHPMPYVREVALDSMGGGALPLFMPRAGGNDGAVPPSLVTLVGENLGVVDLDVRTAACRLVQRAGLEPLRAQVIAIAEREEERQLRRACTNAAHVVAGRVVVLEILARRLVEPALRQDLLFDLLLVFEHTGAGGSLPVTDGAALSERWLAFIAAHRAALEAGERLSLDRQDIPADLIPDGIVLFRGGQRAWPRPR